MRPTLWVMVLCLSCAACGPRYAHLPPESPAKLQVAERHLRSGKYQEASEAFRTFLSQTSAPTFRARAYYELAQAEFALGNHREALDILDKLHIEFPAEVWGQVSALRGDAHHAVGNRTEAFLAWEEGWAFSADPDRGFIQGRMEAAVPNLEDSEALELSELVTVPPVYAMIAERVPPEIGAIASARAASAEQLAPLEEEVSIEFGEAAPGEEAVPTVPVAEEVGGLRQLVLAPPVQPSWPAAKIACLFPLSGPDKTYGARALSGLRLAFEDAPDLLTVRDTGGDPAIAAQLLDQLVATPSILAVVGPLRSTVAAALAPRAGDAEMPLLSLAQGEQTGGPFVFPLSLTRLQQTSTLVAHATAELKARRFGVVYPDDGYGRNFKQLFVDAVRKAGGQVVGSLAYTPGQMDFGSEVATVRGWYGSRQLDAVFIPDGATTATSLASDLRVRMPKLALLGTESWNRPEIIARTGDALEGAVFADAFFADSTQPSTRTFVERFQQRSGRIPTAFEAQAFDAGMLIRRALDVGAVTRADVAAQLVTVGRFDSAGRLLATGAGFRREVFLLRIHAGRIEEISG